MKHIILLSLLAVNMNTDWITQVITGLVFAAVLAGGVIILRRLHRRP